MQHVKILSLLEIKNHRVFNVGKKHCNREVVPSSVITLTYIVQELLVLWLLLRLQLGSRGAATERY